MEIVLDWGGEGFRGIGRSYFDFGGGWRKQDDDLRVWGVGSCRISWGDKIKGVALRFWIWTMI